LSVDREAAAQVADEALDDRPEYVGPDVVRLSVHRHAPSGRQQLGAVWGMIRKALALR
jgi:hypothetical protein